MGNPSMAEGRVRLFASDGAWIEGAARDQLAQVAAWPGVTAVAGMPDLHPGRHGPVGCAVATEGVVYPDLVGSDIGCGMLLARTDLKARKLKIDRLAEALRDLEGPLDDEEAIEGEFREMPTGFEAALGTVGGGNHFCEVQLVHEIAETGAAALGLAAGDVVILVHSGSRGFGGAVLERHRRDGAAGLALAEGGLAYVEEHERAVRFAALNRRLIAMRAADAMRCDAEALVNLPHNVVELEGERVLHRKGVAPADRGVVPLPGSRGDASHLMQPLATMPAEALASIAHGAGRKYDRGSMHGRVRTKASDLERLARNPFGGRVICEDRALLVEEAPEAYKDVGRVVRDLEAFGIARSVAVLRPLVTFKTADGHADRRRRR